MFIFTRGILLNLVFPVLTVLGVYGGIVISYYLNEKKNKKLIIDIFGRYVSKSVADELLAHREKIELKGETKKVAVLFADIRGFTSLSEKMTPQQVVSMLNKYLGEMTDSVFKYGGTLDKYIGDNAMAVFNAPLDLEDYAFKAVQAAYDMQKKVEMINKHSKKKVYFGVGINAGKAVIGNIGSKERLEYTTIGDTVNLASRLCGVAKGGEIIISEEMYKLVKDKVKTKRLGKVKVKGKKKSVLIYQVTGFKK
jgi:adenylate cyclase